MKRTLLSILLLTPYSLSTGATVNQSTTAFDMVDIAQIEAIKKWRYSVQLSSASTQTEPDSRLAQLNIKQKLVYIVKARSQNHTWYRMRLGFFDNYAEAQKAANEVRKVYPDAWVTKAPTEEINYFLAGKYLTFLITASGSKQLSSTAAVSASPAEVKHNSPEGYLLKTATPIKAPIAAPLSDSSTLQSRTASKTEGRLKSLMERARQAMIDKQYNRAIELYNNVLREAESIYSPKALELMGLALERKGQLARARESYRRFLKQYPKHEGYTRVKQRLDALITAAALPKEQLRKRQQKSSSEWSLYGGVSQFYRRDENTTEIEDDKETSVTRSSLSNDLYLTGRYRSEEYDMRTRFSGGYEEDFLDSENSELSISTLYMEALHRDSNHSLRIGRQSESKGGILGRFDGLTYKHSLNDQLRLNLVTGFPVESSTTERINTDLYFYGLNADLGTFGSAWDYNVFFIEQYNHDLLDRRAIGGEIRYFKDRTSLFSLIDYDISYQSLNNFMFLGSWSNPNQQTFNLSVNYRNSPYLTTSNSIQSQGVNDLAALMATGISEEEARRLAEDRTAASQSATLGMVQPINDQLQLNGDITISSLDGTPASGGVDEMAGTGTEVSYFIQGIGSDLLKPGDLAIVGFRYSDLSTSQRYALSLNTRYPVNDKLRINPKVQLEYRTNANDNTDHWFVRPSLRLDYRLARQSRLELELGGEISSSELTEDTSQTQGYFISFGYRHDF